MAEPGDQHVGARTEADPIQCGLRGVAQMSHLARVTPEVEGVTVMRLRRERDVICRGEIQKQRSDLEGARQSERAAAIGRNAGDVIAGQLYAPAMRKQLARQLADQRLVAGSVRSVDRVQLA